MPGLAERPSRVCFLIYSTAWGGMESHTLELARRLASRGHRVRVVELGEPILGSRDDHAGGGDRLEIEHRAIGPHPVRRLGVRDWHRKLQGLRADVGVFVNGGTFPGALAMNLAARWRFRRLLAIHQITLRPLPPLTRSRHFHGLLPGLGAWWYRRLFEAWSRSIGQERIIAVSRAVRDQLASEFRYPGHKLVVVANGIDPERFSPDPAARLRCRAAWRVPGDAILFGSVSRLENVHKGLDISVALFAQLCRANPGRPLYYAIVGEGPDRDQIRAQALAEGIADRVVLPGSTDQPWEAHRALDFELMTSHAEGLPLTIAEAMATGVLPIAMGVGGVPELICAPDLGWLVPYGDQHGFLGAMQQALDAAPESLALRRQKAREHILRNFNAAIQFARAIALVEGQG